MTIKEQLIQSLEKQITDLKALEQRQVAVIKDKVMREKIAPFNQELDQLRAKAESEKAQELAEKIAQLQQKFAEEKKALVEAGERKKQDNLTAVMATETYDITTECEKAIAKLNNMIKELKE